MKKLISILLIITMLLAISVTASADSFVVDFADLVRLPLGDIDADTVISSSDVATLKKVLMAVEELRSEKLADMNYDGSIDVVDLVRLKKKTAGAPLASLFEKEARTLKNKILNAADSKLPAYVTRTVFHVSADGAGDSSATEGTVQNPYSYEEFLNGAFTPSKGNAVLFKRGDVFRGTFRTVTNVFYGAYGTGPKPQILGSAKNYAKETWKYEGNNIYSLSGFKADIGLITFDDKEFGFKKDYMNDVKAHLDFYYTGGTVYIYLDKAPTEYEDIEIGTREYIIVVEENSKNVTIDNLCIKYGSGNAIEILAGNVGVKVTNCEIGYIGGGYLYGTLRFGNAVEFWCASKDALVENNWIYQIYDTGITHQGAGGYYAENLVFNENLIEYCGMGSIEYWLGYVVNEDGSLQTPWIKNTTYSNNICRFAGYCWGGYQRPDKVSTHIRSDITTPNPAQNFKITGNIFDQATDNLVEIGGSYGTFPIMSGNIYAQHTNGSLGTFANKTGYVFDLNADETVKNFFKDSTAKVYWY